MDTGSDYLYEEGVDTPSNCKLTCGLDDNDLWCDVEDVWKMLDES